MEKNPGGQKFWQRGGGEISWNSILPPPPQMRVAPKMPPKFRDLAAATGHSFKWNSEIWPIFWLAELRWHDTMYILKHDFYRSEQYTRFSPRVFIGEV